MTDLEVMQLAKLYMDKLTREIHPVTDREIPEDGVLNNVRLARDGTYQAVYYDRNMQRFLLDHMDEILAAEKKDAG